MITLLEFALLEAQLRDDPFQSYLGAINFRYNFVMPA